MTLKTLALLTALLLSAAVAAADPHISGDKTPPPNPPAKPHCPLGC